MSLVKTSLSRKPDFEGFLFADIGTQPNGLPLTVLSLFARAGVDPWSEAERLSQMSRVAAISYMMSEINRAPAVYRSNVDVAQLAKSLVARLPGREPVKPIDVSVAGTGFEGLPMMALMMMFYAILAFGVLALVLAKG
jgi:hypothetical protein